MGVNEEVQCNICDGKGKNDITVGSFNYKDYVCPFCKGKGVSAKEEKKK